MERGIDMILSREELQMISEQAKKRVVCRPIGAACLLRGNTLGDLRPLLKVIDNGEVLGIVPAVFEVETMARLEGIRGYQWQGRVYWKTTNEYRKTSSVLLIIDQETGAEQKIANVNIKRRKSSRGDIGTVSLSGETQVVISGTLNGEEVNLNLSIQNSDLAQSAELFKHMGYAVRENKQTGIAEALVLR